MNAYRAVCPCRSSIGFSHYTEILLLTKGQLDVLFHRVAIRNHLFLVPFFVFTWLLLLIISSLSFHS